MAGAIGPGDWVECVEAGAIYPCRCGVGHEARPEICRGALYRVAAVLGPDCDGEFHFRLAGVENLSDPSLGFFEHRFRLVYRPRADFIESLKQPSPARELEEA
jgi:hypothetical protein